jgi:hypothetical protein
VEFCPQNALELVTVMIDLEDKLVAAVTEEHKKNKIHLFPMQTRNQYNTMRVSMRKESHNVHLES